MLPFTAHADYSAEEALCRVNFFEETLNILAKCAAGAAFEVGEQRRRERGEQARRDVFPLLLL